MGFCFDHLTDAYSGILYYAASGLKVVMHTSENDRKGATMPADIGEVAPDFTLPSTQDDSITLSQFRGQKHVILSFHVLNFTGG